MSKTYLVYIFIAFFIGLLTTGLSADESASPVDLKKCAPDGIQLNGEIDLTSIFASSKDQLLYVDFWASWCGPCKLSFPFMNQLHSEFDGKGLEIIAISVDKKESDALKFLKRNPSEFAVALDSTGTCPELFDVQGMPHSFIVDHSGKILYSHIGFRPSDPKTLKQEIKRLLEEQKR